MRRFRRGLRILWVCFRYGLDDMVLGHFDRPGLRVLAFFCRLGRKLDGMPRGQRLREALEKLGPIFVKFGQVLSTRRDLLPQDIADELSKLQDRVPPFTSELAIASIEKALQRPISEVFVEFSAEPVASASVAQVHFAKIAMPGGDIREVAVKVLRPGIKPVIEQDLSLMHMVAGLLSKASSEARRLRPQEVVSEFEKHLRDELDLVREAANAAQLRRNMERVDKILIPEMYWDYCRTDVLVMERMNGVPINQTERLRAAGVDIPQLARDGMTIFFTQVFMDGYFHADMHPGNIHVSLEPETFGHYILLDFGIVGTLTEYDKDYLAQNFAAFFRRDYRRVAQLHIESGWVPRNTRVDELESAIRAVCEPYFDRPLRDISLGMLLMRLFQTSRRFHVRIQPQLVMLQKTMLNVEGLGRELDPDLDLWSTAKPFLEQWMSRQIGPRHLWHRLREEAPMYTKIFPELPRLLYESLQHHQRHAPSAEEHALLEEQRRTNHLLQTLLSLLIGFVLGIVFVALIVRIRLF